MFKNIVPECAWSHGRSPTNGRLVDSSSEFTLISSGVFSLAQPQIVPPRHCVSRGIHQRGLLRKVEAILEPCATRFWVPGHLGNAIGRPIHGLDSLGLGYRIVDRFGTGSC